MKIFNHEQNTPEWMAARLGLPTASSAKLLIKFDGKPATKATMEGYAQKLAADLFAGEDTDAWEGNKYTERGHEIEDEARSWLSFSHDIEITQVGFCTNDSGSYGCSPDGLIRSDNGLVEIKCLPKNHVKSLLYWHKHGKAPSDYIHQVHMQMMVTNADYCLLCYYHRTLPKIAIRIDRDPVFDAALTSQLDVCIKHRDSVLETLQKIAA